MLKLFKQLPGPRLTRSQQKGLFLFSLLIFIFLSFQYWRWGQKSDRMMISPLPGKGFTVELNGKVKKSAILTYPRSTTVNRVIQDAGGLIGDRGFSSTDGSMVLENDLSLTVLQKETGEVFLQSGPISGKALWVLGRPIPLKRATADDLSRLPGVGPALAGRIIEYRETHGGFSSLEQLKEIKGIKEKTFEKIKGFFIL
jgi:competence protein ComEA